MERLELPVLHSPQGGKILSNLLPPRRDLRPFIGGRVKGPLHPIFAISAILSSTGKVAKIVRQFVFSIASKKSRLIGGGGGSQGTMGSSAKRACSGE